MRTCKRLVALLVALLTAPVAYNVSAAESPTPIAVKEAAGGYLGVQLGEVPDAVRAQLAGVLPPGQGVLIRDVVAGSPAAKAGLKVFDILLHFGDQKLFTAEQLSRLVRADSPNTSITLRYVRGGAVNETRVTLGQALAAPEAEFPAIGKFRMPTPRHQFRPFLSPSESGPARWDSFNSLSLKKLEDGNFRADIQYFGEDGKLVKQTFSGSLDSIREQIMRQKNLPPAERDQLLDVLSAREAWLSPGNTFAPLFYLPHWFNWPSDF
jgi:membrane-associated protease RseP (regulator of RpoE activity)